MKELQILSERVSILEKHILQLAKWTEFDLKWFENDSTVEDNVRVSPNNSGVNSFRAMVVRRGVTAKAQKCTARKSTSGRRGGQRSCNASTNAIHQGTLPASSPRCRTKSVLQDSVQFGGDTDIDVNVDVKMEHSNNDYSYEDTVLGDNLNDNYDDDVGDCDYQLGTENSDLDSSPSDDGSEEDNAVPDKKKKYSVSNRGKRKPTLHHTGKSLYRNIPPLRISSAPAPKADNHLNPIIKMDNLSAEELEKMNVVIPPPRRILTKGPHPCPHCDQLFEKRVQWRRHQKYHRKTREKKQPVVRQKRHRIIREKKHDRIPREKKQPTVRHCPHCPKTFTLKSRFVLHLRSHTGERPFLCFHCGHTSKSLAMLNSHLSLMHPDSPRETFQCDKCEKSFLNKCGLVKHSKRDHGENGINELAVQCHLCTIVVTDKNKLKRHIEDIHEDKRRYSCHLCGQMFKQTNHLNKHIKRHDNPNRRKRGPQKPMIRGELLPQPNNSEEQEQSLAIHPPLPAPDKVPTSSETTNYILPAGHPHYATDNFETCTNLTQSAKHTTMDYL